MKSEFFLKTSNISVNQIISGDSEGVNDRHMWFDFNTSSETTKSVSLQKQVKKDFEIVVAGQAVQQMSQIV